MDTLFSSFTQDPYRMLLTNVFAVIILLVGLCIYRYVYPRKVPHPAFLLFLISVLPIISIFRNGGYESGDLFIHAGYGMFFYQSLMEGNLIPRWAGEMFSGYGGPLFVFQYTLPYYIISLFHFLGFSFLVSTKLLLIISYIASGQSMYLWIKDEFGKKEGFLAALFYLFTPYLLIDLHFRVSVGEVLSFVFIPLCFWAVKKVVEKKKFNYMIFLSAALALLILSHMATALGTLPLLIIYGSILIITSENDQRKSFFKIFLSLGVGLLLSAFFWLPAVVESSYSWYGKMLHVYDFKPITEYLYAKAVLGLLFQGHNGETYFLIGYAQLFVIFASLILLLAKKIILKKDVLLTAFALISFTVCFFMMQGISEPLWNFPLLKGFQFPWRLLAEISILTALLAAITIKYIPSKTFFVILSLFVIFSTFLNWGNRKAVFDNDSMIAARTREFPTFIPKGEPDPVYPIWVNPKSSWMGEKQENYIETLSGNATVIPLQRSTTNHEYKISVTEDALIKENTFYFPGWKLTIDCMEHPINSTYPAYPGLTVFPLTKGDHYVKLTFSDTFISTFSKLLSLLTLLFISLYFFFRKK